MNWSDYRELASLTLEVLRWVARNPGTAVRVAAVAIIEAADEAETQGILVRLAAEVEEAERRGGWDVN